MVSKIEFDRCSAFLFQSRLNESGCTTDRGLGNKANSRTAAPIPSKISNQATLYIRGTILETKYYITTTVSYSYVIYRGTRPHTPPMILWLALKGAGHGARTVASSKDVGKGIVCHIWICQQETIALWLAKPFFPG